MRVKNQQNVEQRENTTKNAMWKGPTTTTKEKKKKEICCVIHSHVCCGLEKSGEEAKENTSISCSSSLVGNPMAR
jgi:hypothetical protein